MDYLNDLHDMCDVLARELGEANDKVRQGGGKLSGSDLDYVDKLTHALKSIKTTIAMIEAEDGNSYNMHPTNYYRSNGSYMRGNDRRRGGYSRAEDDMHGMIRELREMANDLPSDKQREVHNFIKRMEEM